MADPRCAHVTRWQSNVLGTARHHVHGTNYTNICVHTDHVTRATAVQSASNAEAREAPAFGVSVTRVATGQLPCGGEDGAEQKRHPESRCPLWVIFFCTVVALFPWLAAFERS